MVINISIGQLIDEMKIVIVGRQRDLASKSSGIDGGMTGREVRLKIANASLVLEDGVEGLELVMCGVFGQVLKVPIKFIVCHHLLQHTRPSNC